VSYRVDAENKTGFTIDGVIYGIPTIDTFNMDEAQVMFDYCGLTMEDFVGDMDDDDPRLKNPGFLRALVHISYQRAFPSMAPAKVKATIGKANLADVMATLEREEDEEEDARPPESMPTHSESSLSDSAESKQSSGRSSESASEPPAVRSVPIGIGR
jgi:hypothetical protein